MTALLVASALAFAPTTLRPMTPALAPRSVLLAQPAASLTARAAAPAMAAAAAPLPQPLPQTRRSMVRAVLPHLVWAVVTFAFSLLCVSARAIAATAKVASTSDPLIASGDVLKWGGLAAFFGTAYVFRRKETPVYQIVEDSQAEPPAAAPPAPADGADAPSGDTPPAELSDAAMFAEMQQRMRELAAEREAAEAEEAKASQADSTDGWGEGNTAVLEPPKPDADDDAPREGGSDFPSLDGESEFPLGFPLRDGGAEEWREEVEPIASADDIAMLERMFGARE